MRALGLVLRLWRGERLLESPTSLEGFIRDCYESLGGEQVLKLSSMAQRAVFGAMIEQISARGTCKSVVAVTTRGVSGYEWDSRMPVNVLDRSDYWTAGVRHEKEVE